MPSAPSNYDPRFIQDMLNRLEKVEKRFGQPVDKITLRASDDPKNLKDITVDTSDVITAVDAT